MTTTPTVTVEGLPAFVRALAKIDRGLERDITDAGDRITRAVIADAGRRARSPLATLAVSGLTATGGDTPAVSVPMRTIGAGVLATDVFYGAEFGGRGRPTTMQFPPYHGDGYFLTPAVDAGAGRYRNMWIDAVDDAFDPWRGGAHGRP